MPSGKAEVTSFSCPQDFGYYPHPTDCTQYYVCVFGGALQESCTGGLVYRYVLYAIYTLTKVWSRDLGYKYFFGSFVPTRSEDFCVEVKIIVFIVMSVQ